MLIVIFNIIIYVFIKTNVQLNKARFKFYTPYYYDLLFITYNHFLFIQIRNYAYLMSRVGAKGIIYLNTLNNTEKVAIRTFNLMLIVHREN